MKQKLKKLIIPLLGLIGLTLLLYPQVSDLWNRRTNSQVISDYTQSISELSDENYAEYFSAAAAYNEALYNMGGYMLSEEMYAEYEKLLDVNGHGIMAYLEIPSLDVSLPIYHGTDAGVLQIAIGHIEWTSLPIGGSGTHCVVCGHRGMPNAKLFSDLPKMQLGDVFYVRVLDELLTYEVDQIKTVLPDELDDLRAEAGMDFFTLLTCTPYGINSHRLLVRGHRIPNSEEGRNSVYIASEAAEISPTIVASVLAAPFLLLLLLPNPKPRSRNKRKTKS